MAFSVYRRAADDLLMRLSYRCYHMRHVLLVMGEATMAMMMMIIIIMTTMVDALDGKVEERHRQGQRQEQAGARGWEKVE